MEKYEEKFIVINKKHLNVFQLDDINNLLGRLDLPDNKYYVCNQDEPYADAVIDIILNGENKKERAMEWKRYRRTNVAEMCQYSPEAFNDMSGISVSPADKDAGCPKEGDMIARNPEKHNDKWLVAAEYFKKNFEEI